MLLNLEDLKVELSTEKIGRETSDDPQIIKGVNWGIEKGEVKALLGPNGSGKSVLAQTISGNPSYKVTSGKIILKEEDITTLSPEERAKRGIALSWQAPPAVKGIKLSELIHHISDKEFEYSSKQQKLLNREVNTNLSGGERKLSEITQLIALEPEVAILDEVDSGLDADRLKEVIGTIKKQLIEKGVSLIVITHSGEILNHLKPDTATVMVDGEIICEQEDYKKVLKSVQNYGYERCRRHSLSASE